MNGKINTYQDCYLPNDGSLNIIMNGWVMLQLKNKKQSSLGQYGPGTTIGEEWMFKADYVSPVAYCTEECNLLQLSQLQFSNLKRSVETIGEKQDLEMLE